MGHLLFSTDFATIVDAVSAIQNAANTWVANAMAHGSGFEAVRARLDTLRRGLERDVRGLPSTPRPSAGTAPAGRKSRHLAGVAGFVEGVFNFFGLEFIDSRGDDDREAVRATVKEVEALRQNQMTDQRNIVTLAKELRRERMSLGSSFGLSVIRDEFHVVEAPVRALRALIAAIPTNRLSPAIEELVSVPQVWEEFKDEQKTAGWRVAVDHYYDLFQLPASFWFTDTTITIAVHVPLRHETANPFQLFHLRSLPLLMNNTVYETTVANERIAYDNTTGVHQIWTTEELDGCMRVGDHFYCTQPTVTFSRGQTGCLKSIWDQDAEGVMKMCPMTAREASVGAWVVNATHFLTVSPTTTPLQVQCGQRFSTSTDLIGQQLVWIRPGCTGITSHFSLRRPATEEGKNLVVVVKQQMSVFDLKLNGSTEITLERPISVKSSEEFALRELNRVHWSFSDYLTLALSIAAIGAVTLFIVTIYVKVRRGLSKVPVKATV